MQAEQHLKETIKETAKETVKKSIRESAKESAKEPGKESVKESAKKPGKESVKESAKESASKEEDSYVFTAADTRYMKEAIRQAKKAAAIGEVPIGCVIVCEDRIIARGYNRRNIDKNTLAHAEAAAIRKASKKLGDWRLEGCTMYVTLEPCPMCAGALVQARIDRVVIGAMNPKAGCAGSVLNILQTEGFNHQVGISTGLCQAECAGLLSDFFAELRKRKKKEKDSLPVSKQDPDLLRIEEK